MDVDKGMILELIKQRGDDRQLNEASEELPDRVDTAAHARLLEKYGIHPAEIMNLVGGVEGLGGSTNLPRH
jgi:hypothetical protein